MVFNENILRFLLFCILKRYNASGRDLGKAVEFKDVYEVGNRIYLKNIENNSWTV